MANWRRWLRSCLALVLFHSEAIPLWASPLVELHVENREFRSYERVALSLEPPTALVTPTKLVLEGMGIYIDGPREQLQSICIAATNIAVDKGTKKCAAYDQTHLFAGRLSVDLLPNATFSILLQVYGIDNSGEVITFVHELYMTGHARADKAPATWRTLPCDEYERPIRLIAIVVGGIQTKAAEATKASLYEFGNEVNHIFYDEGVPGPKAMTMEMLHNSNATHVLVMKAGVKLTRAVPLESMARLLDSVGPYSSILLSVSNQLSIFHGLAHMPVSREDNQIHRYDLTPIRVQFWDTCLNDARLFRLPLLSSYWKRHNWTEFKPAYFQDLARPTVGRASKYALVPTSAYATVLQPDACEPAVLAPNLEHRRQCPALVFVYNMPPRFVNPLHLKNPKDVSIYAAEQRLYRSLRVHSCRTHIAEHADYFFVPVLSSHAAHEKLGTSGAQLQRAFDLLNDSLAYITSRHPYYTRSGGKDHFWVVAHDIGSCLAPLSMISSIFLQSNGDVIPNPEGMLYYLSHSSPNISNSFRARIQHPCFSAGKDVVIPPHFVERETLVLQANDTHTRTNFVFFRGSVRNESVYSNGIRQFIRDNLVDKPGFLISFDLHKGSNAAARYWEELRASQFCLCPPGWVGWSPRLFQAVAAGCIPVLFGNMTLPFQQITEIESFIVRIPTTRVSELKVLLESIPDHTLQTMRQSMANSWRKFTYPWHTEPIVLKTNPLVIESRHGGVADLVLQELGKRLPHFRPSIALESRCEAQGTASDHSCLGAAEVSLPEGAAA